MSAILRAGVESHGSEYPLPKSAGPAVINFDRKLLEQLAKVCGHEPDKPEETAQASLRALWFTAAGDPRSCITAQKSTLPLLDEQQRERLYELVQARCSGMPLAYLTGRQHFMGIDLLATPGAMIPRQETEILAHTAMSLISGMAGSNLQVVDLCTGSGNIALAIAAKFPQVNVTGGDLSADAIDLARWNADFAGLASRAQFRCGDLFAAIDEELSGRVDVMTCNPPYISTGRVATMRREIVEYEPYLAFNGGPTGVSIMLRLMTGAPKYIKPGGWLVFEVGLGQGRLIQQRISSLADYDKVETACDDEGNIRVISARRAGCH